MKTPIFFQHSWQGFVRRSSAWGLGLSCLFVAGWSHAQEQPLLITAIHLDRSDLVISVTVPPGLPKVTLESRERCEAGTWVPRAVARLDGSGGQHLFRLPVSKAVELVRVRADENEPLPAFFYSSTNTIGGEPTSSGTPMPWDMRMTFDDTLSPNGAESGDSGREVVESDLWKIREDRLYFFNQLRGLQVLDIQAPDRPAVISQLDLPAAGEQMYLLPGGQVVLLARVSCSADYNDQSQILIVNPSSPQAQVLARLPIPGYIQESRLVGTALYVASQAYRPVAAGDGTTWEWGLVVSSFDLADPTAPVTRDTLWFGGYGNVITATDRFLFVVTQEPADWRRSIVHSVDIADPRGGMRPVNTIRPAGRVPDKFKMDLNGDVFTVISQVQATDLYTRLETFSLADPALPRWLGGLSLGRSERLHATRFAGDRVYVVTFFVPYQLDPLWVVDLSNPSQPAIRGELEIPGFSTFLHPMGDQLVALGIETNRTTVSLFDVADPARPTLQSRVNVGDGWAWTEANSNEKAFSVLQDHGLILLPFQSWTEQGYVKQVQLIDLNPDNLVRRGVIDHEFWPRRATVHRNRILSLSARELLTVDASDRDHPEVVTNTELAWSVDRLLVQGPYLVELETGQAGWWDGTHSMLRVAQADSPQEIIHSLALTNLPLLGTAVRNGRLYLAQGLAYAGPYPLLESGADTEPAVPETNFFVTIVDLEQLPDLTVLGQTSLAVEALGGGAWTAVWPQDDLLVWIGGGWNYWWRYLDVATPLAGDARVAAPDSIYWWPYYRGNGGHLLAFDVSQAAAPELVSDLDLSTNAWWNFSQPYTTADGLVYLSHQATVFVEDLIIPNLTVTNEARIGTWMQYHYLDVVDYADPRTPTVRPSVVIPGQLRGLARDGALLYTVGYHFNPDSGQTDWTEYVDASAYDGVKVYPVDALPLPQIWPRPVLFSDGNVFLGVPGYSSDATVPPSHYLQTWTLSDLGRFTRIGQLRLSDPANQLATFPGMLTVQDNRNVLTLFDRSDPANLREIGRGSPLGCLWFDLLQGDGSAERGLWLPLGVYGVAFIPVNP